ncbi:hypothetical protein GCM10011515_20240 [Tsuneonella deserti]|uniref:PilZ domain-containing protein n=1 Tax=Tsuneonella deserti TaxID=2035528 RepID=A0ABQ1S906_9SPHN|nr:PilZ domain-containing protein [Tsuneonella deserti]GGE00385.1 hypothetical protein GCM10011515_20240 [Tsuneonella deserti]
MNHSSHARDPSELIGRRLAPRTQCELVVDVKGGGDNWGHALLCDISASGFRIAHLSFAAVGNSLWLRIPGMEPFPAKIRWKGSSSVGCEFLYPLSREKEAEVIAAIARPASSWADMSEYEPPEAMCA